MLDNFYENSNKNIKSEIKSVTLATLAPQSKSGLFAIAKTTMKIAQMY